MHAARILNVGLRQNLGADRNGYDAGGCGLPIRRLDPRVAYAKLQSGTKSIARMVFAFLMSLSNATFRRAYKSMLSQISSLSAPSFLG
jgi:hypothetical protein